jgi:hypothetical protein
MLCGGGPPRAGDMLGAQWTNGQSVMRNFYVIFKQVVMLTMYNKSEVMANAPRVVARFYPSRIGRLSLAIVAEVLPFLTYLQSAAGGPTDMDMKMWKRTECALDSTSLTNALKKSTKTYLGVELGIRPLRQILITIDRDLVRQPLAEARDEAMRGAYEAQAGHSEATEEHNYGVQLADLSRTNRKTLLAFFGTSTRSHELYQINDGVVKKENDTKADSVKSSLPKHADEKLGSLWMIIQTIATQVQQLTLSASVTPRLIAEQSLIASTSSPELKVASNTGVDTNAMYTLLRQLYGLNADFRLGQLEACRKMLTGHRDLFVQLPTGGGKTLLVEMAALHDRGKVNIMFVPYDALRRDVQTRLQKVGVNARAFTDEHMGHVSVVLLTPEKANTTAFRFYWQNLHDGDKIGRVFWDECHLIEMEAKKRSGEDYRPYQRVLDFCARPSLNARQAPQRIFLSATLPAEIKKAVQKRADSFEAETVQTSTSRPSMRWEVQKRVRSSMESSLEQLVRSAAPEKVIIYVKSYEAGKRLESRFDWGFYHGGMGDEGQKIMDTFNSGQDRVLVATTAAGSGWDADVELVILWEGAFDAITAAQQGGRAGRTTGKIGRCVILIDRGAASPKSLGPGTIAWNTFLTTDGCRRVALESYLDDCWRPPCHGTEERCDNCTVTDIDDFDFDIVQTPRMDSSGPRWAFQNTIAQSSDSLLNPHDTERWSSPPSNIKGVQALGSIIQDAANDTERGTSIRSKIRTLRAVDDSDDEPPTKRVKGARTEKSVIQAPLTSSGGIIVQDSLSSESFDMISSASSLESLLGMVPSVMPASVLPALVLQAPPVALTSRQRWDAVLAAYRADPTLKRQRIIQAMSWIRANRVWCVHCWFYRQPRWDDHTWNSCRSQQDTNPGIGGPQLDGLKITMKRYWRLPTTPSVVLNIHLNCWVPLRPLHPAGNFDFQRDCEYAALLLAVVETGLRDSGIGRLVGDMFKLSPAHDEQMRAETLLRPSPDMDSSIVLWDAFLLVYGYGRR